MDTGYAADWPAADRVPQSDSATTSAADLDLPPLPAWDTDLATELFRPALFGI